MDQGYLQEGCSRPDYRNSRGNQDGESPNGDRNRRKNQTMTMSASSLISARVRGLNSLKTGLTTTASEHSSKSWRVCYAEHHWNEQVLLHQELYGHALQVQQDTVSDQTSTREGTAERRSVHRDVEESKAGPSLLVRQDLFQSLREAVCTRLSVYESCTGGRRAYI